MQFISTFNFITLTESTGPIFTHSSWTSASNSDRRFSSAYQDRRMSIKGDIGISSESFTADITLQTTKLNEEHGWRLLRVTTYAGKSTEKKEKSILMCPHYILVHWLI